MHIDGGFGWCDLHLKRSETEPYQLPSSIFPPTPGMNIDTSYKIYYAFKLGHLREMNCDSDQFNGLSDDERSYLCQEAEVFLDDNTWWGGVNWTERPECHGQNCTGAKWEIDGLPHVGSLEECILECYKEEECERAELLELVNGEL